jgi:hypothetical protein
VSYIIVDLDGTLILDGDLPNQPLIDHLNEEVMSGEAEIIVVSARKIDRLQETRAWLQENKVAGVEDVFLNDFEGSAFATGFAFKEYKYGLLKEQYGDELMTAIDNDPAVREMARGLGLEAYSPEEYLADEERVLPDAYRPAGTDGAPEGQNCGNCSFYQAGYCTKWDANVKRDYYCAAWKPAEGAYRADAPAPESDQITGSDENAPGSASGKLGDITLSEATEKGLQTKSDDHN